MLAEDKLFATLDPTTRRIVLPRGTQGVVTDTVGFISKLPTQLVAAFSATLEEIKDASLLLHVVDISHSNVRGQVESVDAVLQELGVGEDIKRVLVWNKVDAALPAGREAVRAAAESIGAVCVSALTGEGIDELRERIEASAPPPPRE